MTDSGGRDEDADWSVPLDDFFVARAPVRGQAAAVRATCSTRIAAAHASRDPWRGPTWSPSLALTTTLPAARLRRRDRRAWVLNGCLVLSVAALIGTYAVHGGRASMAGARSTGPDGDAVPVPADARPSRWLPLPPAVPGDGGYALLFTDQGEARWDPCRPVHYVVRPDGAPPGGDALVRAAFAQLSSATGLVFVDDGPTNELPIDTRDPVQSERYGMRWAPVLVAWSDAVASPALAGEVVGYAGAHPGDPDGRGRRLLTGTVVLDAPQFAEISDVAATASIVLHELGHLAGLDHVEDPADTMAPSSPSLGAYTAGALRGLRRLGDGRCFS